jgi:hypothetical protein
VAGKEAREKKCKGSEDGRRREEESATGLGAGGIINETRGGETHPKLCAAQFGEGQLKEGKYQYRNTTIDSKDQCGQASN